MNGDPLLTQLREFAARLAREGIPLIIGGGYGLLLKASYIQRIGARTRLEQIPVARSTGDIDVFLTTAVIIFEMTETKQPQEFSVCSRTRERERRQSKRWP